MWKQERKFIIKTKPIISKRIKINNKFLNLEKNKTFRKIMAKENDSSIYIIKSKKKEEK